MTNKFVFPLLFIIFVNISYSQSINLSLKDSRTKISSPHYKKTDLPLSLYLLGIAALISPMVVFEDRKVFFGITKELSFGKYPYGRASIEYSYIFRSYNTSHLRFSYNYDYFFGAGDFMAFAVTIGGGYFTDTQNKGWFGQTSGGVIFAASEVFTFYPNLKYRHTFIKDQLKSDINDISLGVAFIIFF